MRVLSSYTNLPDDCRGGAIAIGNFDGVHLGHQAVITKVRDVSETLGIPSGVIFFSPHPRAFFQPAAKLFSLTSDAQKLDIFERLGLDFAAILTFDRAFADLDADAFVANVLVAGLDVRHVAIGYDFFFGKDRSGAPETMQALGARHGFDVTIAEPEGDADDVYSSSRIRRQLSEGDVAGAAAALGRVWSVRGIVKSGAGRGMNLGFPTANLSLPDGTILKPGIYAVRATVAGKLIDGAAYLGSRPTFDNGDLKLETFLFDFNGNLYGDEIEIAFVAFIRGDQAFTSAEDLAAQMARDCEAAKAALADTEAPRETLETSI